MYQFYKTMNKLFYELKKLLLLGGILAFIFGLVYLFFISIFYSDYEVREKLDNFLAIYYLGYCINALVVSSLLNNSSTSK